MAVSGKEATSTDTYNRDESGQSGKASGSRTKKQIRIAGSGMQRGA